VFILHKLYLLQIYYNVPHTHHISYAVANHTNSPQYKINNTTVQTAAVHPRGNSHIIQSGNNNKAQKLVQCVTVHSHQFTIVSQWHSWVRAFDYYPKSATVVDKCPLSTDNWQWLDKWEVFRPGL